MPSLAPVLAVLAAGVRGGDAPGAAAIVLRGADELHASAHGFAALAPAPRPLGQEDLFDLASVTKVYVASAVARLWERGRLDLDAPAPVERAHRPAWRPSPPTWRQLLAHASGLAAWRPWYEAAARDPVAGAAFRPRAQRPGPPALAAAFRRGRALVATWLSQEKLEAPPGTRAVYSDLGFIALGFALERLVGAPLADVVDAEVLRPLGLSATSYRPGERVPGAAGGEGCVATRRSAARGGEVVCGEVDDDNAWALGGVAGHAGLFGTAREVARFGQAWLDALAGRSRWLSRATAAAFVARDATPGSDRALGWDTPTPGASALGTRLGRGPRGAVGHLGFTGTSLWLDLDLGLSCALLTNHVHPDGADRACIRGLRQRFHDAVAEGLKLP